MSRSEQELREMLSKISEVFYTHSKQVIVFKSEAYYLVEKGHNDSKLLVRIPQSSVERQMATDVPTLVVDMEGRVLDTNIPLCEECGEPILELVGSAYCSVECMECNI